MKQELLEVADQGLQCLALQSNVNEGEDSAAKVVDSQVTEGASFKTNGNTGEKIAVKELENTEAKDEEIDVFVEQDQANKLELEDEGTHRLFKLQQPLEVQDEDEKFFIVQSLDDKETDQDRVIALMKNQDLKRDGGSSDYDDITDMFRDIEIEDLEAEKENVGGNNGTDVEKFLRDNNPLMSKIHYRGDHKKLQDTSNVDSCLETYEEIII